MARVIYDGRALIPAPLVTVTKNYKQTGDNTKIGVIYDIVLTGTLLPFRGSPSGTFVSPENAFWTLSGDPPDESFGDNNVAFSSLIKKQEAIRHLFSQNGKLLEMYAGASPAIIRCNPRIIGVEFQQGQWVDRIPYTITLQADWVFIAGLPTDTEDIFEVELIDSGQENWTFSEIAGLVGSGYTVSHTISAHGIAGYDETGIPFSGAGEVAGGEAWKHAKTWCDNRAIGVVDPNIMFAIIGISGLIGGSYSKNTNLTHFNGDYSITETWILSQQNYFIQKSFTSNKNVDGKIDASYSGKITGISEGEKTGGSLAITNAKSGIPTNSQAKTETENALGDLLETFVLGTAPSTKNVSINNADATVNFAFSWSTDENETFIISSEASLSFDEGNGTYNLSLSCTVQGKGDTPAIKLANAKAAILNGVDARLKAIELVGDELPVGVTIATDFSSKSVSMNETQGSVRFAYTWKNTTDGLDNFEVSIDIQFPNEVVAIISIPGRVGGPIIQDMETTTQQIVTVTLSSPGNTVKPDNATVIGLIEDAADFVNTWILESDKENYSPTSGKYTRTRSYIVD